MKKIAWITDSTCGLPQEFIDENNIHVLPLSVLVNGESYKEDVEISKAEFYEKLKEYGEGAKTSQPAYGEFLELYEKLVNDGEYERGIAIHASAALTGGYYSSVNAAEEKGFPVEVIDSKMGAYALGKMIRNGLALEEAGHSYEEIVETMRTYPEKAEMYLLPSSLEQLKLSGRVSTSQAVLASLLNINILLAFDDGKVVVDERIRTKSRAKRRVFKLIDEAIKKHDLKEICVMDAGVKDVLEKWVAELQEKYPDLIIKTETLVPVAGVHTGFGTMAVSWLPENE